MKAVILLWVLVLSAATPALAREAKPQIDPKLLRAFDIKIREAQEAFLKEDIITAEKAVSEAQAIFPQHSEVLNIQGAILYKQRKYPEALVVFQELLKRDPTSFAATFNLGEVLFMDGRYDEARAIYERVIESNPGNEPCLYRLVLIIALQGKFDEARLAAKKIPHPGQTAAYYFANAAVELAAKNPEKASDWIKQSEVLYPPETSRDLRVVLVEHGLLKK